MPLRELAKVVHDARGVGAEIVRPVGMDKNASLIVFVVSIAAEVIALIDNKAGLALLGREALGNSQASEAGADDEAVDASKHGAVRVPSGSERSWEPGVWSWKQFKP
jgi:hypothetical protein